MSYADAKRLVAKDAPLSPKDVARSKSLANASTAHFEAEARRLGGIFGQATAGAVGLTPSLSLAAEAFESGMRGAYATHMREQAFLGQGGPLTPSQALRVEAALKKQDGYLRKFVRAAKVRVGSGRPWSPQYMANRASMYAGPGIVRYSQFHEEAWLRKKPVDEREGWVERYRARDDNRTCSECSKRHNTLHLPGRGPMPAEGTPCGSRCRCVRIPEKNMAAYNRLKKAAA